MPKRLARVRTSFFSVGDRVSHHKASEMVGTIKRISRIKVKTETGEVEEDRTAEVQWECGKETTESIHHLAYEPTLSEIKRRARQVRDGWDETRWRSASGLPDDWDKIDFSPMSTMPPRKSISYATKNY